MATPQLDAVMASSVVVDMRSSFGRRTGRKGVPTSVPQVAALAVVAVQRPDHVGGRVHRASVPVAGVVAPTKLIAENRRSRHDYELLERVEAGIVLSGTEVKALRAGHAQLGQAFADVRGGEMWLIGASISEYAQGNISNHITDRDRKLLLKRSEIDGLYAKVREKGLTLVPTKLYFKDGKVKVEIALGRGKDKGDKRRAIADRDARRQMDRALKARR
jgi:SsrA-binding protein